MDSKNYNDAERAVDKTKWTVDNYADRAKDYIREQKANDSEATAEGWMERAKENVADAWEDTKDAVSHAWEKTKDWSDDAWDSTKDAGEDVKAEWNKKTN
ncbi:MAG: hypothetical protein K0M56_08470 [Kaistella sp.]|nr:hypothetical protein [Kaistella sp.]